MDFNLIGVFVKALGVIIGNMLTFNSNISAGVSKLTDN